MSWVDFFALPLTDAGWKVDKLDDLSASANVLGPITVNARIGTFTVLPDDMSMIGGYKFAAAGGGFGISKAGLPAKINVGKIFAGLIKSFLQKIALKFGAAITAGLIKSGGTNVVFGPGKLGPSGPLSAMSLADFDGDLYILNAGAGFGLGAQLNVVFFGMSIPWMTLFKVLGQLDPANNPVLAEAVAGALVLETCRGIGLTGGLNLTTPSAGVSSTFGSTF